MSLTAQILLWSIAFVALALNIAVTIRLATLHQYSSRQKLLQLLLVWAIPVADATIVWLITKDDERPQTPAKEREFYEGGWF
ncbi:MAG: hypothetical protein KDI75_12035 [Xanthomonadales bacterium]|nr:hypothetical protein [Xanthomonadales bacterium]